MVFGIRCKKARLMHLTSLPLTKWKGLATPWKSCVLKMGCVPIFSRRWVWIRYSQPLRPDILLQKSFKGRYGANHEILGSGFRHVEAEILEGNN